jgi:hypothetical protein
MTRVYRIQGADGRGPWRPGFSVKWCDPDFGQGVEALPPYFVEFGHNLLKRRGLPGEHYGCAVRKPQDLRRWVSTTERAKLAALNFNVVSLKADRILAESKNQLVFACRIPLSHAAVILPWEIVGDLG